MSSLRRFKKGLILLQTTMCWWPWELLPAGQKQVMAIFRLMGSRNTKISTTCSKWKLLPKSPTLKWRKSLCRVANFFGIQGFSSGRWKVFCRLLTSIWTVFPVCSERVKSFMEPTMKCILLTRLILNARIFRWIMGLWKRLKMCMFFVLILAGVTWEPGGRCTKIVQKMSSTIRLKGVMCLPIKPKIALWICRMTRLWCCRDWTATLWLSQIIPCWFVKKKMNSKFVSL